MSNADNLKAGALAAEMELQHLRALLAGIKGLCEAELPDNVLGQAVRKMMGATLTPPSPRQAPVPVQREVKHLKVKLADGTLTNVSLPTTLLAQLATKFEEEASRAGEAAGAIPAPKVDGLSIARKTVSALAKRVPLGAKNRSGWLQDELTKLLAGAEMRD